jgi:hypothetical protein
MKDDLLTFLARLIKFTVYLAVCLSAVWLVITVWVSIGPVQLVTASLSTGEIIDISFLAAFVIVAVISAALISKAASIASGLLFGGPRITQR